MKNFSINAFSENINKQHTGIILNMLLNESLIKKPTSVPCLIIVRRIIFYCPYMGFAPGKAITTAAP